MIEGAENAQSRHRGNWSSASGALRPAEGLVEGLTPAQWTVLRYFARANRFSRTPSRLRRVPWHDERHGVADDYKNLEIQGYLMRIRFAGRRPAAPGSTSPIKGRAILVNDPCSRPVVRATDDLPPGVRNHFAAALQRMLGQIRAGRGRPPFGTARLVSISKVTAACREGRAHYACGFIG